tara:strand:+ start:3214 stop:4095 length:882 start_codon:yes stop_codon:yes gene_type:complete
MPNIFDKHRDAKNWNFIYNEDYNIDILFMGSSLIFTSLDPNIIDPIIEYDSFNLGSSSQNIIQAYYNLIEVLKYKKIKLIVLDVNTIVTENVKIGFIYNNLSGMYFSENKINSFLNSINKNSDSDMLDLSQLPVYEGWINIACLILKEKFNWKNDIKTFDKILFGDKSIVNNRGFLKRDKLIKVNNYNKAKNKKIVNKKISLKNDFFLKSFISLCDKNDIDLIFLQTPTLEKRTIRELDFYEIPYYNFGFSNDNDYYDYKFFSDEVHLSTYGAEKFSLIFADSLKYFLTLKQY